MPKMKRHWRHLVTSARLATVAGLIVAVVGVWQVYLNFYAKDEVVYLSVAHAHLAFMDGRLDTSLNFSNGGNTSVTIAYAVASLRRIANPEYNGPQLKKGDFPTNAWQLVVSKPFVISPGEVRTIPAKFCLPPSFDVKSQLSISIVAYFSDYMGNLHKAKLSLARVAWTNMLAGPEHKVIGYSPVALFSKQLPYDMFSHASTVNALAAYARQFSSPECSSGINSNISLNLTALKAGALRVPSALRAPAAG